MFIRKFILLGTLLLLTAPAQAAFHLWGISEIYTSSNGTVQFIEFSTTESNQQFTGGQQIQFRNASNGTVSTLTLPGNLPNDSANHTFLLGTANLQSFGGPAPDFIMPANSIIFPDGGISFFGANSGTYTNLPTTGNLSRIWGTTSNQLNNPKNFAGVTGFVVVPEPITLAAGCGLYGLFALLIRRCNPAEPQPRLAI